MYQQVLKAIYQGKIPADQVDQATTLQTAQTLMKGVYEGFGGDFTSIQWNTPDYDKLMHLERNVYQFSGAKNWQMLRELTSAMVDGSRVVPFAEFKSKAVTILGEYDRFLRTEYNAAVAGSQMASKWVDIEKTAETRKEAGLPEPLLEYRTAGDARVREEHRALHGIIRPVSDHFWTTYYPPNGWNCRCTVIRLNEGRKTSQKETNRAMAEVTPQRGFNVNLAQEGFVFAPNSPYYIGLPRAVRDQVNELTPDRTKKPKKSNGK